MDLVSLLTSQEMLVVYVVVGVACLLCIMIYIVEKNTDKRRMRHNTRELNKLVEQIKEEVPTKEEEVYYEEPVMQVIPDEVEVSSITELIDTAIQPNVVEPVMVETIPEEKVEQTPLIIEEMNIVHNEEEFEYTTIEPDQKTAQLELQKLTAELQKEESIEQTQNISLTNYEEQQEENAIISLEELVKKGKEMYESNEATQYADEGNVPISLQELEQTVGMTAEKKFEEPFIIDKVVPKEEVATPVEVISEATTTMKSFQNSPIISPIYGIEGQMDNNSLELENTANYEKLDAEIKRTNEFLMSLKELQEKLD